MGSHLYQTLIALDNLGRLPRMEGMSVTEWDENRALAQAYLARRR